MAETLLMRRTCPLINRDLLLRLPARTIARISHVLLFSSQGGPREGPRSRDESRWPIFFNHPSSCRLHRDPSSRDFALLLAGKFAKKVEPSSKRTSNSGVKAHVTWKIFFPSIIISVLFARVGDGTEFWLTRKRMK